MAFAILFAAIPLAAGTGRAARLRHSVSNIDGSRPPAGSALDLSLRYITNTTEQLLLFSIAAAILAPDTATTLLPVMGVWFLLAGAASFVGYRIHPLARAAGFAATFHSTIALLLHALARPLF